MIKTFILGVLLQTWTFTCINGQYYANSNCMTPNYLAGTCIGIRQCAYLVNVLQTQSNDPAAVDFLRRSQCGFEGNQPKVCCPITSSNANTPESGNGGNRANTGQDSAGSNDANLHYDFSQNPLLPADCGKDLSVRIVGGERTELDEFPWMTLLEYAKYNGKTTACGGVLISSRYVLTAAHCVKGKDLPKSWRLETVRLGEYDTTTDRDCIADGEDSMICADDPISVGIEEQIAHESYNPLSRDQKYDIALLRLSRDVPFTNYIKPICLPSTATVKGKPVVAGWGKTESRSSSEVKLKLALPLTDREQCLRKYGEAGISIGYGQICAGGQRGKDSCRGDSGGPLMTIERTSDGSGRWSVAGIVSFGPANCGLPDWPGVYTRVIDFVPWILEKIRP